MVTLSLIKQRKRISELLAANPGQAGGLLAQEMLALRNLTQDAVDRERIKIPPCDYKIQMLQHLLHADVPDC